LSSTVVVPANVSLVGPVDSVGGQRPTGENFNQANGVLYLSPNANLEIRDAASVSGLYIIASNLRGKLPLANSDAAVKAVAAFTGIAFLLKGSDVHLHHLMILGFNTAIRSNDGSTNWYRQKFEWIDIDCTNGIDIYKSADIGRIAHVHAWDFLTYSAGLGSYSLRSGTAFKVASNFDEGKFFDNFAYGYAVGFDIGAMIDVTLLDCGVDSWAANPNNPGQIGVKISGGVTQVKIIGGAYSAMDKAIDTSSSGSLIVTGGVQFFGNNTHIHASSGRLAIIGNSFNYGNTIWGGKVAINISAASAPALIANNVFDTIKYAYSLASGPGSVMEQAVIWGNQFNNGAADPFVGERMVTDGSAGVPRKTFTYYSDGGGGQGLSLRKSRGSMMTPGAAKAGDAAGWVDGEVWNGTAWIPVGQMRFQTSTTPDGNPAQGEIVVATGQGGQKGLVDTIAIGGASLYPIADNATALGYGKNRRWSAIYAVEANFSRINSAGEIRSSGASGGIGYAPGAGGAVAQQNNKSERIVLNSLSGRIKLSDSMMDSGATNCFILSNSTISAADIVVPVIASGATAGGYALQVDAISEGAARICLSNRTPGRLGEAIVINFAVIKGAIN
jgi:hypothetical protein